MNSIASTAPTPQYTNETFFQGQQIAPAIVDPMERTHSLSEERPRSFLNQRFISGNHSISLEERPNLAVPPSNQQIQLMQTIMDRQADRIRDVLNSPLVSSNLRQTICPIFEEVYLNFSKARCASTLQEICNFLKKAEEAISNKLNTLLDILCSPLGAEFERRSAAIFTTVEKAMFDDSENLDLNVRKNQITADLRRFLSESDPIQNPNSGTVPGGVLQEFRHKFNERKSHLRAAVLAIEEAPTHDDIDTILVNLVNKIKRLHYPISDERFLFETKVFAIPEALFELRRQLGEQIFRP